MMNETNEIVIPQVNSKPPWPWWSVFFFSLLSGLLGSYFIVWQNLKRLGQEKESKLFIVRGGLMMIVLIIISFIIPTDFSKGIGSGFALISPLWLNVKYLSQWQKENPKMAKFSWSIVGWGVVGLVLYLAILLLVAPFFE